MSMEMTLQARGLCKSYTEKQVLKDLDITIQPGHIYGLLGRNGAGKTTLLGILTGQNTHDSGTVTLGGEPVWENRKTRRYICFSREQSSMTVVGPNPFKVRNYLRAASLLYPNWDGKTAEAILSRMGIQPKQAVNKLSKGQQSMVTVAIAMASGAPITILDEPVAGLDVMARREFYRMVLEEFGKGERTFVISTHIIEEAAGVFDRVILLDEGKVLADEETDVLVNSLRTLSGPAEEVEQTAARLGLAVKQMSALGSHRMAVVQGKPEALEALEEESTLTVGGVSLQDAFVALCGHSGEE